MGIDSLLVNSFLCDIDRASYGLLVDIGDVQSNKPQGNHYNTHHHHIDDDDDSEIAKPKMCQSELIEHLQCQ